MGFTPLRSYLGYEHVLNAAPFFVHPNGTVYGTAIEKQKGLRQNLTVWRRRPGQAGAEQVHRLVGGVDSAAQIAMGGCVILPNGSLEIWGSAVPLGVPPITGTGFVGGYWDPIPGIDEPWTGGAGGGAVMLTTPIAAPAWSGRALSGGVLVDVPIVFGVPAARRYDIRFVGLADRADIRIRAGTTQAPHFVTVNTQTPGLQVHTTGPTPGPTIYVSSVDNAGQPYPSTVWMHICGYQL